MERCTINCSTIGHVAKLFGPTLHVSHGAEVTELESLAAAQGFAFVQADVGSWTSKRAILEAFRQLMRFPPGIGNNWDSLNDALSDLSWYPAGGHVFVAREMQTLIRSDDQSFAVLVAILRSVVSFRRKQCEPFYALATSRCEPRIVAEAIEDALRQHVSDALPNYWYDAYKEVCLHEEAVPDTQQGASS